MPETWATTNGRSALAEAAVSTGDETLSAERALEDLPHHGPQPAPWKSG